MISEEYLTWQRNRTNDNCDSKNLETERTNYKREMVELLSKPYWHWTTWGTGTYSTTWRKDIFPSLKSSLAWYSRNYQLELLWFAVAEHHADREVLHSHFLLSERRSLLRLWDVRMQLASFYRQRFGRIQVEPYLPSKYGDGAVEQYLSKYVLKNVRSSSGLMWDLGCFVEGSAVEFSELDSLTPW